MEDLIDLNYGYLFEKELLAEIRSVGTLKKVAEGNTLINIGDSIRWMPLIVNGAIKVLREEEDRELILYFIEQGDTCAMTISCCFGQTKSEIRAVAETDTELIIIPIAYGASWMSKYKSWQNFMLRSYKDRMMELLETIDTIAFFKMDQRLLKHLQDKAKVNHKDEIQTTHQDIASDLNTSRVVISRLLKTLENRGKIKLQRNCIKVIDL